MPAPCAFQQGCTPADYRLSKFGVDTVNTEEFRVALRRGHCAVDVTTSFRVVPQQPHVTGKRQCAVLRRSGAGVVAVRCSGGPPATISLTESNGARADRQRVVRRRRLELPGTHPGLPIVPLHLHRTDDEAWIVLEGRLGLRIGDEEREVAAGESALVS